jgi:hypothetical protein
MAAAGQNQLHRSSCASSSALLPSKISRPVFSPSLLTTAASTPLRRDNGNQHSAGRIIHVRKQLLPMPIMLSGANADWQSLLGHSSATWIRHWWDHWRHHCSADFAHVAWGHRQSVPHRCDTRARLIASGIVTVTSSGGMPGEGRDSNTRTPTPWNKRNCESSSARRRSARVSVVPCVGVHRRSVHAACRAAGNDGGRKRFYAGQDLFDR